MGGFEILATVLLGGFLTLLVTLVLGAVGVMFGHVELILAAVVGFGLAWWIVSAATTTRLR